MHTAKIFPAEQIEQIFDTDLISLQNNLLISLQIKFAKKNPKKQRKNKYGIIYSYLKSFRWKAIMEKTILYKTTVDK